MGKIVRKSDGVFHRVRRRQWLGAGLRIAAGAMLSGAPFMRTTASAQTSGYPNRQLKLIVPYPPGGNTDIIGRTYSIPLAEALGQSVIVENRGGAAGTVGATAAARSTPDGYTLVVGDIGSLCIARFANSDLQYDPIKDFTPVSLLATVSILITARGDFPASSFQEFLAVARANPGKFTCGTGGVGSIGHLSLEMLKSMAGLDIVHVPYRGGAPAATDLMGGQIDLLIDGAALSMAKAGRIKALAVTGDRIQTLPDVPTVAESGVPGFHLENFWGILMPAGSPPQAIEQLNAELNRIAVLPRVRTQLENGGFTAQGSTPDALAILIRSTTDKISEVVKTGNVKF
jgi:tripartite-type tricarboxylate transporter receptor subunit TctC